MKEISLINIFKVFLKIGAILFGGGYVIVPIMKEERIEKRNWIDEVELADYYCVSHCLAGLIAINMAMLVGYKLRKIKGAVVSVFAMMVSPVVCIILIANLIEKISKLSFMDSVFYGVNISVIVLIYLAIKDIWHVSLKDKFSAFWFLVILFLSILKINPVYLIVGSIAFGILLQLIKNIQNKNEREEKC